MCCVLLFLHYLLYEFTAAKRSARLRQIAKKKKKHVTIM